MKTKHIQYKAGLLIGLLSLSTLSSCANTKAGLGMGPLSSKHSKDNNMEEGGNKSNSKSESKWGVKTVCKAIGTVAVGVGVAYGGYNQGYNQGYDQGRANASNNCLQGPYSGSSNSTPGRFNSSRP
uniref:hypothetical protein n=1 Tax=Candidatus Cardinium sp. TP TaxID=2961955 RepID=UPI0021AE868A|nr:hypothetical protein [Candidatus Cardinium sp. TP]MCT4696951.1 hypothetical protein [Candidatus Cardinium sp. TP]MDN5246894.1 hypothetical protein [Candidatus Cardinium sp.]